MTSKTKYIVIVLLLLVLATTSVGLSTWNIHYQAIVGDIDFTATEPGTQDSVLNRYIYFTPAKDADGNITTIKQSYPIGRGGAEDIFTYIYDAKTHTPTVFVPSEEDIKGSDSYPTDLFLADGALNLDWGIEDVFDEIEFKYEYRLIAMPFVADYKGKSDNYCEVHSVTYGADTNNDKISDSITVCISWKNGKGNHNGENVTVVLGVDGTFTAYDQNSVEIANPKISASINGSRATIGVDGFNYYNFNMESNGWTETAPSDAGVYQCRITAQLDTEKSAGDTVEHINAANTAIEQLNSLTESGISYAAQVTYAILPAQVEQANPTASYSDTTQTFSTRRLNTANAPTSSQSETVDYQDDTNGSFSFNEGAIVGTSFVYKGQNYNISITSNVQISNDLTFSVDYAFDQEKNAQDITEHSSIESSHIYTTYGFSSNPNYVVSNPEAYYCIIKQEVKITGWTGLTTTYNGAVQEPIVTLQNHRGETIDAEHGEIKAVLSYSYNGNAVTKTQNAGVYTVAVSLADAVDGSGYSSQNYKLVNAYAPDGLTPDKDNLEVDFTIQKAPLTVTAKAHKITYGDALSNYGVSYSGFIGGDNKNNSIFGDLQITSDYDTKNATKRIVGSYTLTPSGYEDNDTAGNPIYANDGHHNYTYTYATGTLTVEKLVVDINWTNLSFTFDSTEHKPTATVNNKPYEDDTIDITIGFDGTTTEAINAGTYTAKATGLTGDDAGNYTLEGTATPTANFTISPKDISSANITITSSLTYNGSEQTVAYTVTIALANDTIATLGEADFTATGDKATNAYDNPTLTLIGKGNYCSTITQTWKIAQLEIGIDWTNTSFTYDGKSHKPTATATGIVASDTIDITIELDGTTTEAINAGTYTAKATGLTGDKAGNYKLPATATKTFTIAKAQNTVTSLTIAGWTYGQNANKPSIQATYTTGVVYTYSADGTTFTSEVPTNAGAYTIKAEIDESTNYLSATATATFTIEKAENKITSLTIANWTFSQTASTPVIVATYAENVVYTYSTAQDGEYTATVPTNAGTYYIKAEIPESANYLAATATPAKFTINKAPNEITSLTIANWTFGQSASIPVIVATYAENVVYTYSADGSTFTSEVPTNAGTYTIKAEIPESDNYLSATAKTATFTINKAPNAIVWSDDSLTADKTALVGWTYGSTPVIHTATDSFGTSLQVVYYTTYNATTGECSGEFTPSSTTSAGTYYAKAVSQDYGSNHHGMPSVMSFAVTPATLVGATVTLQNHENLVYDGTEKTVAIAEVRLANDTVLTAGMYNVTGLTATNAGTHTVTVTVPNYEGSATAEFVISQKELTLTWGNTSFTYNGSAQAPTVTVNGVVSGDNYVVTVEGAQTNAGNYTATAKAPAGGNYKISGSTTVNFSIAKASVTSANCTTNDIFEGEAIKLTGTTANGVTINSTVESVSGTYTISDASNAVFSNTGESSQTVGKTIKVLFTPSNGNYKATILDVNVNVKAVAYIKNGNYFGNLPAAVESAKNGTNKTVIVIVGTTINISENLTLDNSITVKVPYDGETTMATVTSGTATLKSTINFTNEADLIINNGSTLELGGQISTKGIIGSYCQINLGVGSSITVNGSFNAYGYVKETSPVTGISNPSQVVYDNSTDSERYILVSSTGYIITPFKTDDIGSGSTLMDKIEANVCPTYNFQFHALQTYVKIETGGILASTAYVQAAGTATKTNVGIIYPSTSSTESMFYQESGTISIEWCSTSKTIIYVSGTTKVGKIYIQASGVTIDSDNMFIPIHSRFSIYISGTLDTNGKKIKFLPGSYVEVLKGGFFNVNGTSSTPSKIIIYPLSAMTGLGLSGYTKDAEFVNNGTVTLNEFGYMGGTINTTTSDGTAVVDLSNVNSSANLSLSDVEIVGGKGVNIADVALTGPFYDETTQSTEMSLFSHGSAINSHPEMSCWVGAIVLMDDITLTVLKTGVPTEAFNYTIYTNSTASDSGQYEQIPSNTSTRSQSFSLKRGTYIKIEDIVSTAIAINGEAYTSGTWIQVSGPMAIEITPTASFTVTVKHTNGTQGAGNIKRSITYGPNKSSMTEVVSTENGSSITAKIPMGWVFKVSDNANVNGTSKVTKTTYNEDGTTTQTDIATASKEIAWSSSTIYTADGDYLFTSDNVNCFAPGTLITMADGSLVAIENLKPGDFVLSYDFETGAFVPTIVAEVTNHGLTECQILTLNFNNNTSIRIIASHGFFDVTEMRYLDISVDNYQDYIGHEFMAYDGNGNVVIKRLVSATVSTEETSSYSLTAAVYINAIADGLITITPPMTNWYNMFDVDGNFKWNEQLMAQDIDKYGLFTYAEVESMIPYEIFVASNFRYFKVAMAKGLVSMAEIEEFVAWYNELIESGEIVLGDMSQFLPPQENTNTTDAVEATLPPPVVTGSDDNSGDGDGSSDEDTSE